MSLTDPSVPYVRPHTCYVQTRACHEFFVVCMAPDCTTEFPINHDNLVDAEAEAKAHGELRHIHDRQHLLNHERKNATD